MRNITFSVRKPVSMTKPADPVYAQALARFAELHAKALADTELEPTAMSLATVDERGQPALRTVLLKHFDSDGFVFYTNTQSRKGRQLAVNARAALLLFWRVQYVQVEVEGEVEPVSPAEADAYFASRPRLSQLGAWASLQSQPLPTRATLDARLVDFEQRFAGHDVPRPPHWSGYRLRPELLELWFGAEHRLHHRDHYSRHADGWRHQVLYP